MGNRSILKEGSNCWRVAHADRAAFLVDAAVYFECLAEAFERARHSIYIAGWDIDSRIHLRPPQDSDTQSERFSEFLNARVDRTPGLRVHILCWDYAMIYAMEREWLTLFKVGWKAHERIHFKTDAEHPLGASHHQKIVVIDDTLAFSGGIDITNSRWDTPEHRLEDPRRRNPDGKPFDPFHDTQMAVAGDAAAALGDLFRTRWHWATGVEIDPPEKRGEDPWPPSLTPDITDAHVAVARTLPAFKGRRGVREVERLYLDMIRSAEDYIYIENQYLTSLRITDALADRLGQQDGPEVLFIMPRRADSLLAQSTMDAFRMRNLRRLFDADAHDRLRVLYPVTGGSKDVYVHSKVMVVDGRIARVGSANLTNRSMGLDTECDLAVDAGEDDSDGKPIRGFLHRLLADHLGIDPEEVADAMDRSGSPIHTLESLSASGRSLVPVDLEEKPPIDGLSIIPEAAVLDPEDPIDIEELMDNFTPGYKPRKKRYALIKPALLLLVVLLLAASWKWTPLSRWIDMELLADWGRFLKDSAAAPFIVLGAYVLGGLIMFPVTILVGTTAILFGAFPGSLYALSGCLLSAAASYGIGASLGGDTLAKFTGGKFNRVSTQLARQGILTVAVVRNIPVAPFSVVNLVAGASRIKFRDYIVGTALGMAPGVLGITVFTDRLLETFHNPNWFNIGLAALVGAFLVAGLWWIKTRLL
jgi:phosphatidylserine/phosphatidylglycerophosphate/cardiolipin synthase-like enzyme/uncharacterized membrane protein YdjX (TVP38/TMEM64 family)